MDSTINYIDEFNVTAPDLSRQVNVMVFKTEGNIPENNFRTVISESPIIKSEFIFKSLITEVTE